MKKTFQDVLKDIQDNLVGKTLESISGRAATFVITSVDRESKNIFLDVNGQPEPKKWSFAVMEKIWEAMNCQPTVSIESITGGSNSSRNQPETIYASLAYVKWLHVNGKKCIAYVRENCHPYGTLQKMEKEELEQINKAGVTIMPISPYTGYKSKFERNRILFGAPGTGKSFTLNKEAKELIGADNEHDYERVTFHPDYSYANFVGTYKPTPDKDADGKDTITYKYVPGPFMRTYVKALKNSRTDNIKPYLLIIEEINRANVAAVFGDVFQLLDRGSDNVSEYPIETSEDMREYLKDELGGELEDYAKIRIPDNMFIWATMNSADQGVFPMDTAFKRRWEFTYLGIDENDEELRGKWVKLAADESQQVEWNKLRKTINKFLSEKKINEDKQLGPYFIARNIVVPDGEDEAEINRDKFIRTFKNKVIMYLFEDAAKMRKDDLFSGCPEDKRRYSEICSEFDKNGVKIFHPDIQNEVLGGKKADADKNDA